MSTRASEGVIRYKWNVQWRGNMTKVEKYGILLLWARIGNSEILQIFIVEPQVHLYTKMYICIHNLIDAYIQNSICPCRQNVRQTKIISL